MTLYIFVIPSLRYICRSYYGICGGHIWNVIKSTVQYTSTEIWHKCTDLFNITLSVTNKIYTLYFKCCLIILKCVLGVNHKMSIVWTCYTAHGLILPYYYSDCQNIRCNFPVSITETQYCPTALYRNPPLDMTPRNTIKWDTQRYKIYGTLLVKIHHFFPDTLTLFKWIHFFLFGYNELFDSQ